MGVIVYAINPFEVYKNIVTKWGHVISTNDIITFNEILETLSTAILEIFFCETSHEEAVEYL